MYDDSVTLEVLFTDFELGAFVEDATKRKCRTAIRKLIRFAGDVEASSVDVPMIGRWQVWMRRQKMSVASIRSYFGAVCQMYSWAIRQSLLTDNPFERAPNVRQPKREVQTFTPDEIEDLVDAAAQFHRCDRVAAIRWTATLYTMVDCGLRVGEIWNLRRADLDLENQVVWVRYRDDVFGEHWQWGTKGKVDRHLPISPRLLACLYRLLEVVTWRYPFLKRETCERMLMEVGALAEKRRKEPYNNFYRELGQIRAFADGRRALAQKAPIKNGGPHTIRKTAISHWARHLRMPEVQKLAGHQSMMTTREHYVHIDGDAAVEALRAVPNLGPGGFEPPAKGL